MAEALTLIGGLSAITQLTGSLMKLTRELVECMRTIRSAPKEIEYFVLETSIFTDQLGYFHDLAKESTGGVDEKLRAKRAILVQKIARQCKFVKRGFRRLVRSFIDIYGFYTVPFNTLRARILWLWKKPDVPELRLSLQSATANVMLLCNMFIYEELIKKNKNDERLEMQQEKIQNWMRMARKLRRELADYKRRKQPVAEEVQDDSYYIIEEDTRELEKYVVNAIRSHVRANGISRSSRSSREDPPGPVEEELPASSSLPGNRPISTGVESDKNSISSRISKEIMIERVPSVVEFGLIQIGIGEAHSSLSETTEISHAGTIGSRVRDNGHSVTEEVGEWPTEIHDGEADDNSVVEIADVEQSAPTGTLPLTEEKPQGESEIELSPRQSGSSENAPSDNTQPLSPVEEHSERGGPSAGSRSAVPSETDSSQISHTSSMEESSGPYVPLPPFEGPKSRRRPRRPKPRSSID
ncbi:hypothetical protein GGR54DRAFT_648668 [Hypoxylon sp. NC1633]|nr:hypothetical protein GGR54DRAFT_648668 [Hypoxylon sp. NC1633]